MVLGKLFKMFLETENLGGVHLEVHGEEEEHKVVVLELSLHVHHSDSLSILINSRHLAEDKSILRLGDLVGDSEQLYAGRQGGVHSLRHV